MRRDAGRAELRNDELAVRDHIVQPALAHAAHELVGAEAALARRAPHVDAVGLEHEEPRMHAVELAAQQIEGQLVVGGDEHGRAGVRRSDRVEAGLDAVMQAPQAPTHAPAADAVAPRRGRAHARDGARRRVHECHRPGHAPSRGVAPAVLILA